MDNVAIYWGFIYLILFRISIIMLGGMSIYLGYLLFMKGLGGNSQGSSNQETEVSAQIGTSNLTLKNAAPGTFFALFGSAIVISMVTSQQPEIYLKKELPTINKEQAGKEVTKEKEEPKVSEFRMRDLASSQKKVDFIPIKNKDAAEINQEVWQQVEKDLKRLEYANQLENNHAELLDSLASFYFILFRRITTKQLKHSKRHQILLKKILSFGANLRLINNYKLRPNFYLTIAIG